MTQPSANPIADHGVADRPVDDESDQRRSRLVIAHQQVRGHGLPARPASAADRELEILAPPHPGGSGKHDVTPSARVAGRKNPEERGASPDAPPTVSGAQARPALAPARREDGPARTRSHPQPEPMRLRPTAVVRLKRALAHCGSMGGAAGRVTVRWRIWLPCCGRLSAGGRRSWHTAHIKGRKRARKNATRSGPVHPRYGSRAPWSNARRSHRLPVCHCRLTLPRGIRPVKPPA